MKDPYKDGNFWMDRSPGWAVREYGGHPDGKGDLIFNTCYKIIQDVDVSPWALTALTSCMMLLKARKRWPDRMNQDIDAKNRIDCMVSKWLWRLKIRLTHKYRWQDGMTRDPYIAWITACILTRNEYLIQSVSIPWYLSNPFYAPTTMRWRRRLLRDKRDVYVQRLGYLRSLAVTAKFETP